MKERESERERERVELREAPHTPSDFLHSHGQWLVFLLRLLDVIIVCYGRKYTRRFWNIDFSSSRCFGWLILISSSQLLRENIYIFSRPCPFSLCVSGFAWCLIFSSPFSPRGETPLYVFCHFFSDTLPSLARFISFFSAKFLLTPHKIAETSRSLRI